MKKLISFVLVTAMLISSLSSFGIISYAEADAQKEYLVNIDENMTFTQNNVDGNYNWTSTGEAGTVKLTDWIHAMREAAHVSEEGSSLIVPQGVTSLFNQYWSVLDPSAVTLDKTVTAEMKFRLAADDYSNVPQAKFLFKCLGKDIWTPEFELSEALANTERAVRFVINPSDTTITGYLNDVQFASVTYSAADSITGEWGFWVFVQEQGKTYKDGTNGEVLTSSPITWTYDSLTVSKPAENTSDIGTQTLIDIDNNMTFTRNASTWNMNWTSGTGNIEYVDYTRTMEGAAYVSSDGSSLIIPQTVSSAYHQRFLMSSPNEVALDKPITFEVKFKLSADDYDNAPTVQMYLYGLTEVRTPSLVLSEETANTERILKYVIDPETSTITGYLDSVKFKSVSYTAQDSVSGTWGIFVHVQNQDTATAVDKENLVSPIKWTYNSFTVTKPADTSATPTPVPELPDDDPEYIDPSEDDSDGLITKQLVYIDDAVRQGGGVLSQNGAFEFVNWTGGTINMELTDNDIFKTYQTKGSMWGQRLMLASPSLIALDSKTVFKLRFKCTADDYNVTLPNAQVMFDTNGITTYVMRFNNDVTVLSPTKKDVWRTLTYTIDPEEGTIVGTLDGQTVSTAQITNTEAKSISQASFEFNVGGVDNGDITTPVTWQIDKIEVYQRRAPEAPAEQLNTAAESGAWESTEYENGCGADDSTQLTGCVTDLGGKYVINKVTLDHDSSDIMSWSIMTSEDDVNYTRVSDVYAGGIDEYSGKQIIRFAPQTARYVKYSAVLIGNHYTKAQLNNMKIEYSEPESISFADLPQSVNPLQNNEIILKTKVTETNDEYITSSGISYSVSGEGASINGNVLSIDENAGSEITVTASDMSSGASANAVIKIRHMPAVNNFVLCSDAEYTVPFTSANDTAYIKAELKACSDTARNEVKLIAASYAEDGHLTGIAVSDATASDGNEISAQLTPAQGSSYVKAFVLDKNFVPLCGDISSGTNGISARNITVAKNSTVPVSVNAENIEWVSEDESIATVSNSEISGLSAGTTKISAYSNGVPVAEIRVEVIPTAYVFLMMGQSNMTGTNNPVKEGYTELPVSDNVMLLNNNNEFEPATHKYSRYSQITWSGTYHDYDGLASLSGGINMGYSFAEDWAADNPNSVIGLIVNSQAGCSIDIYEQTPYDSENHDANANGFDNSVERVKAALANGGELAGIIWHQGESNMNRTEYHARLRNVLYDFRLAFNAPEVPVITGGLSEDNMSTYTHNLKSAAQEDYIAAFGFASSSDPELIPSRHAVGCYSGSEADYVHFSAKGQIEFGHRFYDAYLKVLNTQKR